MLKVSVACCTYNGEKFIYEQLQSMANQTRLPDEVVVCDDGSFDNTVALIKLFASTAPFTIRLFENEGQPLRSTKNFEKAITLCKGEIIVLSDQDDVWDPNKVELLEKAIDDGAGLVFSDATLVDENLQPLGYSLFDSLSLTKLESKEISRNSLFNVLIRRNIVTGASIAFSRKHLPLILPISDNWIHDGWIAFLISSVDKTSVIHTKLFKYRQHSKNQIGAKRLNFFETIKLLNLLGVKDYVVMLKGFKDAKDQLIRYSSEKKILMDFLPILERKIHHLEVRLSIVNKQKYMVFLLFKELLLGKYHAYSRGWISFFKDLCILVKSI